MGSVVQDSNLTESSKTPGCLRSRLGKGQGSWQRGHDLDLGLKRGGRVSYFPKSIKSGAVSLVNRTGQSPAWKQHPVSPALGHRFAGDAEEQQLQRCCRGQAERGCSEEVYPSAGYPSLSQPCIASANSCLAFRPHLNEGRWKEAALAFLTDVQGFYL